MKFMGVMFCILLFGGAVIGLACFQHWLQKLGERVKDLRKDLDTLRVTSIGTHQFTDELNRRDNLLKELITGKIVGK